MSAEIETQFLNTFIEEAIESLTSWENLCLNITSENEKETIIQLFRIAHNLKGSAASVGLAQFSSHIHKTEELLTLLKNDELQLGIDIINLFFDLQKLSIEWIHALKQDPNYLNDNLQATSDWLSKLLKNNLTSDSAINQFEIFSKNSADIEKINKESKNSIANEKNKKISIDEYLKVSINKLDNLINYISEIVIDHNIIKEKVSSKVSPQDLKTAVSQMGKNINELQSIAFSLRMTSLEQQFQKMNRIVRDISSKQQKKINFKSHGSEVELDKFIVDKLTDPLTHLIRNAIDHGIESVEDRIKKNKNIESLIELKAFQADGNVKILIKDDGRGIDEKKVLKKAIEKGIVSENVSMTKQEIQKLIFKPGFSTKEEITDISGRGIGLDVVNSVINELKGNIEIESEIDSGTQFIITLPSLLSIVSGIVFKTNNNLYVVPEAQVLEIIDHNKYKKNGPNEKTEYIAIRNEIIPIIQLNSLIKCGIDIVDDEKIDDISGIIIQHSGKKYSFEVEQIISTQDIVLKKLSTELNGVTGVLATTVLGNGEPAIVLNFPELVSIWSSNGNARR